MKKKKVLIFTGSRSEFELQLPVIRMLNKSEKLDVNLLVSGGLLDKKFTDNIQRIENEVNLKIYKLKLPRNDNSLFSNSRVIGESTKKIADTLEIVKPDIVLIYGDRFESFAAMIAASQSGLFTCHFEGGDITNGFTFDDNVRHAMTKLANYHFVTNKKSMQVLKQMGESEKLIELVGLPINDFIYLNNYSQKEELIETYKLENYEKLIIFTLHSEPLHLEKLQRDLKEIDKVFEYMFKKHKDLKVIASYPNGDVGSDYIIEQLKVWNNKFPHFILQKIIGNKKLHGLFDLKNSSNKKVVFLGNSSAGLKETPFFNCPNISIGTRQNGRLSGENTIQIKLSSSIIKKSLNDIFSKYDENFYSKKILNPYYFGDISGNVTKTLENIDLENLRRDKIFVKR